MFREENAITSTELMAESDDIKSTEDLNSFG